MVSNASWRIRRRTALVATGLVILLTVGRTPAQSPTQTINNGVPQQTVAAGSSIEVVDLTPRFLKFYETAIAEKASPEPRWQLWQQLYGFAAVPPTPGGK